MIQRIQTVFLFFAAACGFGSLAVPFATTPATIQNSALFSDATYSVQDNIGLLVLFAVAGALATAGIFLFKNRPLQLKICRFAIIANVLGLILAVILFWQNLNSMGDVMPDDGAGAYLPFVFLVFGVLALRFIRKDENLVKSMDRLR